MRRDNRDPVGDDRAQPVRAGLAGFDAGAFDLGVGLVVDADGEDFHTGEIKPTGL